LGGCVSISRSSRRSLVLLSRSLCNVELEELFLSAWDCQTPASGTESPADSISVALSAIPAGGRSSKSLCASQFFRYSTDDLSLLDVCAVENLLLSESLRLESEDALV
jgi:hypothetical protein